MTAVIRLMLFVVTALELSKISLCHKNYKSLFLGIFSGSIFCAGLGLLGFLSHQTGKTGNMGTIGGYPNAEP